jgi:hypothetical protein
VQQDNHDGSLTDLVALVSYAVAVVCRGVGAVCACCCDAEPSYDRYYDMQQAELKMNHYESEAGYLKQYVHLYLVRETLSSRM